MAFAAVFAFVFIIPIAYAIYISFYQQRLIGGNVFVGIDNYARLFKDQQFWAAVMRVSLFTLVQVPIMLFLAAALALAIDPMKLHGTKFFRIGTFLPLRSSCCGVYLDLGFCLRCKIWSCGKF